MIMCNNYWKGICSLIIRVRGCACIPNSLDKASDECQACIAIRKDWKFTQYDRKHICMHILCRAAVPWAELRIIIIVFPTNIILGKCAANMYSCQTSARKTAGATVMYLKGSPVSRLAVLISWLCWPAEFSRPGGCTTS